MAEMSEADRELMELQRSTLTQGHAAGLPSGAAASDPDAITTWEARRAAQREAYGQFVAAGPITLGNAPAFQAGQQVPLEHVIKFNLEEQELVHRVATPEQARLGKTFESDDEFLAANPHLARRNMVAPEAHPDALDPRGGARHLDTEGVHGPAVGTTAPADPGASEQRRAAAGQAAAGIVAEADKGESGPKPEAPKPAKSAAVGKDKN
jgi:ribosomal 50S subunit-recycling heat shock protein